MTAWLNAKAELTCPRCGRPSSETSVLCEPHRLEAAERWSRWAAKHRPGRRKRRCCAFCAAPSSTYRCAGCKGKRRRWERKRRPLERPVNARRGGADSDIAQLSVRGPSTLLAPFPDPRGSCTVVSG